MAHILLFGATGDTGRAALNQALEAGHRVRCVSRDFPDGFGEHPECEKREGDLLSDELGPLMEGIDTVISAIGLGRDPKTLADPPPLYTQGTSAIIKAMQSAEIKRLVVISAAFADPDASVPDWFKAAITPLDALFSQMADMEDILLETEDIDWTAARPGWLLDREHTGDYSVSLDDLPQGSLRTRRADLADFLLHCALGSDYRGQRPFIARPESSALEAPPALIEEFFPL